MVIVIVLIGIAAFSLILYILRYIIGTIKNPNQTNSSNQQDSSEDSSDIEHGEYKYKINSKNNNKESSSKSSRKKKGMK